MRRLLLCAVLIAAPVIAAEPSAEAVRLGTELAKSGTLGTLLPMIAQKDVEEMVAGHPELNDAEKTQLRNSANAAAKAAIDKVLTINGKAYADRLSVKELKSLVAASKLPAAKHFRKILPETIVETMQAMDGVDFKKDVMAAFCRDTGKGCEPAE